MWRISHCIVWRRWMRQLASYWQQYGNDRRETKTKIPNQNWYSRKWTRYLWWNISNLPPQTKTSLPSQIQYTRGLCHVWHWCTRQCRYGKVPCVTAPGGIPNLVSISQSTSGKHRTTTWKCFWQHLKSSQLYWRKWDDKYQFTSRNGDEQITKQLVCQLKSD